MVTTANLLNYWKCWEDAANTTVEDFHGSNNATASTNTSNLAAAGIPTNLDGSFNYNGTNEHIDLNLTQNTSDNFAYNFWIKTTESTSSFIAGVFDGTRQIFLGRINQSVQGKVDFDIFDGTNNAKVSFTNQTWRDGNAHMLTFVKTGNTQADMKIYLDAVSVESSEISGTLNNTTLTRDIFFGARNNQGSDDFNMAGNISDISRWSSVTEQDITDLYDSGDGNPFPFVNDIIISPSAFTLSTSEQAPSLFIDISQSAVFALTAGLPTPMFDAPMPFNRGTVGTQDIATRFPITEGLIARTTKQTVNPNLEAQEKGAF